MPLSRKLQELKKQGFFTIQDLLKRLESEGFFCTRQSMWNYEKKGILPRPKCVKKLYNNTWDIRLYTQEEIDTIISILKKLPSKKQINVSK